MRRAPLPLPRSLWSWGNAMVRESGSSVNVAAWLWLAAPSGVDAGGERQFLTRI
jgi:hypothetical protein